MTNAEKFAEVFGTDLKRQHSTKSWWDQEFVPTKTEGGEMMDMLINCPNCGAPLTSDGFCNYCKTKVRYANHLEIISDDVMHMPDNVEILLKLKKGDTLTLIPFVGHVDELQYEYNTTSLYCDSSVCKFFDNPTVHISFTGGIGNVPDEEMSHIKI